MSDYEAQLLAALRSGGKAILAGIRDKKELTKELEAQLSEFLEQFAQGYGSATKKAA